MIELYQHLDSKIKAELLLTMNHLHTQICKYRAQV